MSLKITILTDNPNSWIIPYVNELKEELTQHKVTHIYSTDDITEGDVMLILGCERIIKPDLLSHHKSNVVVHPSKLPKGKGFSPLAWQIVEGSNNIPVTLFEAVRDVDAGDTYLVDYIKLEGYELNDEIKHRQGLITKKMVNKYIDCFVASGGNLEGIPQEGSDTFYPRRRQEASELDTSSSIVEQFNTLRVVDNERYPAYFMHMGKKYIVKIYREDEK
tara:strand:- start:1411 stop:2067 length:657 start_codon:yes stop_codon:yes gene_type:complete